MPTTEQVRRYKRRTAYLQLTVVTAAVAVFVLALLFPQS
ncbi:hypothetical protein SAMN06264364_1366 [Quadrisphaera granulorum]|uniref:Uncharacterized protein n=1 Tax=Quadrisphaera granulorum TaxID=317664 RepID=A0A315ZPL3_9ACTN|nr:hypothetical protein BXY45_1366 [Quadrisphaera granulorum]SZE98705.1 hypothetical protein SAMN06264364_1366 [Quadrisphaera granulorum]